MTWTLFVVASFAFTEPAANAPVSEQPQDCRLDHGKSCGKTGFALLLSGTASPEDIKAATSLLVRACDAGEGGACMTLGLSPFHGTSFIADRSWSREALEQAAARLEHGCELGEPSCCLSAGVGLFWGQNGFRADPIKAIGPLRMACDKGTAWGFSQACSMLGTSYLTGVGVVPDLELAARYYQRACDFRNEAPCSALALTQSRQPAQPEPIPCNNTTKLSVGLKKGPVAKLLGPPLLSELAQCGGAKGIKPWPCETVTYQCGDERGLYVKVVFGFDRVESWAVQPKETQ